MIEESLSNTLFGIRIDLGSTSEPLQATPTSVVIQFNEELCRLFVKAIEMMDKIGSYQFTDDGVVKFDLGAEHVSWMLSDFDGDGVFQGLVVDRHSVLFSEDHFNIISFLDGVKICSQGGLYRSLLNDIKTYNPDLQL